MTAFIGDSYILSIGLTYPTSVQASGMKKRESCLDRAKQAMTEKFGTKKKFTLYEIGRLAGGITQPSVSLWAKGSPEMKNARLFAMATDVCVDWFLTGRPPKRPWDAQVIDDPQLAQLLNVWVELSDTGRAGLLVGAGMMKGQPGNAAFIPPLNPAENPKSKNSLQIVTY